MKLLAALLIGVGAHIALASPAMAEPCLGNEPVRISASPVERTTNGHMEHTRHLRGMHRDELSPRALAVLAFDRSSRYERSKPRPDMREARAPRSSGRVSALIATAIAADMPMIA